MGKRYFRVGRKIFYRIIVILFIFQYYLKMVVKYKKICKAGEHLELYNQVLFFNDDIQLIRWAGKEIYGSKEKNESRN